MADSKIPNPLERRHLVEQDLPVEQALGLAEAYLAEDRADEAVAFLVKAGASDRLDALAGEAVESGDLFLLRAIATGAGPSRRRVNGGDWRSPPERWARTPTQSPRIGRRIAARTRSVRGRSRADSWS